MSGSCGSCRYWEERSWPGREPNTGTCKAISWGELDVDQKAQAVTNMPADLETRAGFGCVLWEAKA